jgi:RNA-binding protein 8A
MADLDFTVEDEDVVEAEEAPMEEEGKQLAPNDLRNTILAKKKGRGFKETARDEEPGGNVRYDSLDAGGGAAGSGGGPAKSVEGWVLFVTGLHEEAQEEDVVEAFAEYGDVKNVYLNLDRQTGYVKGYALIEYATEKEAREAIKQLDGSKLLDQVIHVTWAFVKSGRAGKRGGGRS